MKKLIFAIIILFFSIFVLNIAYANTNLNNNYKAPFYFFYSLNCMHCHDVNVFLNSIKDNYDFNVIEINIEEKNNLDFFVNTMQNFNMTRYGYPVVVINNNIYQGQYNNK